MSLVNWFFYFMKCIICGEKIYGGFAKKYCENCYKKRKSVSNKIYRENNKDKRKEYLIENRDKINKLKREYYHKNKKLITESNRQSSRRKRLRLRVLVLERDNFTCQFCGRKSPEVKLEIDHKFPKSKGGKDELENYQVLCRECNNGKGDYILKEFEVG